MLLLAMSCLQARTQCEAFDALVALQPDGVQLTPGNLPSPAFAAQVQAFRGVVREHHGFAWERYRRAVYDAAGEPLAIPRDRSVHPPRAEEQPAMAWLQRAAAHDLLLETMYPGYGLGCGEQLAQAMDLGLRLAVDIAHLHLQRCAGVLPAAVERRLCAYDRIEEIHVSANDGRTDRHAPLTEDTPGLAWAHERGHQLPVVLECYMHRLSHDERRRQVDLARGRGP